MTPEDLNARLLYRDGLILVIDKPAGIPVHRGPKGGESLEDGFDALRFGLPRAPSLAHRLDRDTSGCLVLGRHRKALEKLGLLFKRGKIVKTYWAAVEGTPASNEGLIDLPLARRDATRGWWMKVDGSGAPSQTRWKVLGQHAGRTWLALFPLTGRTHQLRVHCAASGWPIVGDPIYGLREAGSGESLHLHAKAVRIPISNNKPTIVVEAPVPDHVQDVLRSCGWSNENDRADFLGDAENDGNASLLATTPHNL